VLHRHNLPASDAEEAFERVARLTAQTLEVPLALVTFLGKDWQWFNAAVGTELDGTPVDESFCIYTVQDDGVFVVEDATEDDRFAGIQTVENEPHIRFYAGYPLTTEDGTRVGTLCVFDMEPRSFTDAERQQLEDLGRLATNEITLRRSLIERRSTEQRLQGILQSSVAAIVSLRRDGQITYMNEEAKTLLGIAGECSPLIAEGENIADLSVRIENEEGTSLDARDLTLFSVLEAKEPFRGVRRRLTWPDGRQMMIEMNGAPLMNEEGEVEEVVYSVEEITERYYTECLRSHQREILEQIAYGAPLDDSLEAIIDMVESLRPSIRGSIMRLEDDRLYHGAGQNLPDEILPGEAGTKISSDVGACARAAFHDAEVVTEDIATDPHWDGIREVALDNGLRAAWSIPVRGDEGAVLGTLALWWSEPKVPDQRDEYLGRMAVRLAAIAIEQHEAEQELKESQTHFQQLAENIDEVFWLRTRSEMLYVSQAYEDIWGRPFADIAESSDGHLGLVHPSDVERVRRAYLRSWENGTRFNEEYRIVRPDGAVRWVRAVAWAFSVEGEAETRQAGYAVDVTERVRHRHELIAAKQEAEELNRLKTAFLANMSHEIRTPLTSIIGFAEILQDELGTEHGRAPELIHTAGRRLMNTLDSVLQLSRLEADAIRLNPVDVELVDEARDTLYLFENQAQEAGIDLRLDVPSEPVEIHTDPSALQRVLQNLIGNAVKFTSDGYVRARVKRDGDTAMLVVEDTGIGISRDFIDKVYDAFEQESTGTGRSYEGSGLGLTVVNRLVRLMGGDVDVESTPGRGTTVTVTLPVDGPPQDRSLTEARAPESAPMSRHMYESEASTNRAGESVDSS
jgi:PAS domain S-box-containing protein